MDVDPSLCIACIYEKEAYLTSSIMFYHYPPTIEVYCYRDSISRSNLRKVIEIHAPSIFIVDSKNIDIISFAESVSKGCCVQKVPKKDFSESKGIQYIGDEIYKYDSIIYKQVLFASLGCLITYLIEKSLVFDISSINIRFNDIEKNCIIDPNTIDLFSVIYSNNTCFRLNTEKRKNTSFSLFHLLDSTRTLMGEIILKRNLVTPPSSFEEIKKRHLLIAQLIDQQLISEKILGYLDQVGNIKISFDVFHLDNFESKKEKEKLFHSLLGLWKMLNLSKLIHENLKEINSSISNEICLKLINSDIKQIILILEEFLDTNYEDLSFLFIIKKGKSQQVDELRNSYERCQMRIQEYSDMFCTKFKVKCKIIKLNDAINLSLFFKNNDSMIINNCVSSDKVIIKQKTKGRVDISTKELEELSNKICFIENQILMESSKILLSIIKFVKSKRHTVYSIYDGISYLDFYLCIYSYSKKNQSPLTRINCDNVMVFEEILNPLLGALYEQERGQKISSISSLCEIVNIPNSFQMSSCSNIAIISGPNLSGKTTFLQTIVLNSIMIQCGFPVNGHYASIHPFKKIFSISKSNKISHIDGVSHDLKTISQIIYEADADSLVLIDEINTYGTEQEASAMIWSIIEQLIQKNSKVIMVTHHSMLKRLSSCYYRVKVYHMHCSLNDDHSGFQYHFRLMKGWTNQLFYGIRTSSKYLPEYFLELLNENQDLNEKNFQHPHDEQEFCFCQIVDEVLISKNKEKKDELSSTIRKWNQFLKKGRTLSSFN